MMESPTPHLQQQTTMDFSTTFQTPALWAKQLEITWNHLDQQILLLLRILPTTLPRQARNEDDNDDDTVTNSHNETTTTYTCHRRPVRHGMPFLRRSLEYIRKISRGALLSTLHNNKTTTTTRTTTTPIPIPWTTTTTTLDLLWTCFQHQTSSKSARNPEHGSRVGLQEEEQDLHDHHHHHHKTMSALLPKKKKKRHGRHPTRKRRIGEISKTLDKNVEEEEEEEDFTNKTLQQQEEEEMTSRSSVVESNHHHHHHHDGQEPPTLIHARQPSSPSLSSFEERTSATTRIREQRHDNNNKAVLMRAEANTKTRNNGVYFQYLFQSAESLFPAAQVEHRQDRRCPLCNLNAASDVGLVLHLKATHGTSLVFRAGHTEEGTMHVLIHPRATGGSESDHGMSQLHNFVFVSQRRRGHNMGAIPFIDQPELVAMVPQDDQRNRIGMDGVDGVVPNEQHAPIRQYYRSKTHEPMLDGDWDVDSEDEMDGWIHKYSEALLDNFRDVNPEEKRFLSLWNRFIKVHYSIADASIPHRCSKFVREYATPLKHFGLRNEFHYHLVTLWDAGVISSNHIIECLMEYDAVIDSILSSPENDGDGARSLVLHHQQSRNKHHSYKRDDSSLSSGGKEDIES